MVEVTLYLRIVTITNILKYPARRYRTDDRRNYSHASKLTVPNYLLKNCIYRYINALYIFLYNNGDIKLNIYK